MSHHLLDHWSVFFHDAPSLSVRNKKPWALLIISEGRAPWFQPFTMAPGKVKRRITSITASKGCLFIISRATSHSPWCSVLFPCLRDSSSEKKDWNLTQQLRRMPQRRRRKGGGSQMHQHQTLILGGHTWAAGLSTEIGDIFRHPMSVIDFILILSVTGGTVLND